jgi:hypothetical protein
MASVVVEQVVSVYELDASKYKAGAQQVQNASKQASSAASSLGGASKNLKGTLSSLGGNLGVIGQAAAVVAATVGAVVIPMVAGGKKAVETAIQFDTLSRSLTAIVGSGARASQVLGFVDKLAAPSIFDTATLGEAAKLLEAFGLKTERFLPIAEKLGTVFGGNAESLNSFVSALGYIRSGRFGEGFESLARGGVSREALTAKGLSFDKGGSFKGTVEQALTAVEAVVNEKFGKLAEEMASGPAAKLASLGDAFNRAMRQIGVPLVERLLPFVERIAAALGNLGEANVFGDAISGFLSGLGAVQTSTLDVEDSLLRLAAGFVGFGTFLGNFFEGMMMTIKTVLSTSLIGRLVMGLFNGEGGSVGNFFRDAYGITAAENFYNSAKQKMARPAGKPSESIVDSIATNIESNASGTSPLNAIAENTKITAENTQKLADIQDKVLGGGSLGGRGLSRQELSDIQTGRGASGTREIKTILVELGVAIERGMSRTAARAIGNNVSRREV